MNDKNEKVPTLKELYPSLTDEQLADVKHRYDRYLALSLQVFERIINDPVLYEQWLTLTKKNRGVS